MEGFPPNVTPIAWRQVRHNEHFWNGHSEELWLSIDPSSARYLIVEVKPRRVLIVPEHDLPAKFDSLIVGYWTLGNGMPQHWVAIPYTIEERR